MSLKCEACYEDHHDKKQGYKCNICDFYVHEECINVNIPSHHKHPLELRNQRYWMVRDSDTCCLCETKFLPTMYYTCMYRYSHYCNFYVCVPCAKKPLFIAQTKAHEHELHQLPIEVSFTCDACGLNTTNNPCVCLKCCFIIHRACILLPNVIYINRHDHRISRVRSPGPGKWVCVICIKPVNGECGAYSCMLCPYVVHSKCATSDFVWDGRELEGVPEEDEKEENKPFKVIDQDLIKHFSHEHNLKFSLSSSVRLDGDVLPRMEDKHCYACTLPLYFELSYKCTQCDFILHDACANLPLKKRHEASTQQLTLCAKGQHGKASTRNYFVCNACGCYCTGFSYLGGDVVIDVRCASMSGIVKHESHQHSLFVHIEAGTSVKCEGCGLTCWIHLRCNAEDNCVDFKLCFKCATLPTLVRHKYDDHPLSLRYGEKNVNSTYCCGICEEEIFSKSWFYRCNDCASTLHHECVFKNLIHSRPGYSLEMFDKGTFDLLPNNCLSLGRFAINVRPVVWVIWF